MCRPAPGASTGWNGARGVKPCQLSLVAALRGGLRVELKPRCVQIILRFRSQFCEDAINNFFGIGESFFALFDQRLKLRVRNIGAFHFERLEIAGLC